MPNLVASDIGFGFLPYPMLVVHCLCCCYRPLSTPDTKNIYSQNCACRFCTANHVAEPTERLVLELPRVDLDAPWEKSTLLWVEHRPLGFRPSHGRVGILGSLSEFMCQTVPEGSSRVKWCGFFCRHSAWPLLAMVLY